MTWRRSPARALSNTVIGAPGAPPQGNIFLRNPRGDHPPPDLPLLSISAQNCNSLNISTECHRQLSKMIAITTLLTDIIFISHLRLTNSSEHVQRVEKHFLYEGPRPYKLHINSDDGKRGVGILLANDIHGDVSNFFKDNEQNILGLTYDNGNGKIRLVSIYGPNENEKVFFDSLDRYLSIDPGLPVIIGGDFNCTYSCDPIQTNIDCFSMQSPPSLVRSSWLHEICVKHHLTDPYRALNPTDANYTYIPASNRKNRSRIDFFLMGDELIPRVKEVSILPNLGTTILDHKAIKIKFSIEKSTNKQFINKCALNLPRIEDVVWAAVADCYVNHADPAQALPVPGPHARYVHRAAETPLRIEDQRIKVGTLFRLIKEYNELIEEKDRIGTDNLLDNRIAGKNTEIRIHRDGMWDIEFLTQIRLVPNPDVFFETLMSTVKGNVISYQVWAKKLEQKKVISMTKRLTELKQNYAENYEAINHLEITLNSIIEKRVIEKVKSMKIFECLNAEKPTPRFLNLAKAAKKCSKLEKIKKPDGTVFECAESRNDYIVNYYRELFRKPDTARRPTWAESPKAHCANAKTSDAPSRSKTRQSYVSMAISKTYKDCQL